MKLKDKIRHKINILSEEFKTKGFKSAIVEIFLHRYREIKRERKIFKEVLEFPFIEIKKFEKNNLLFDMGLMKLIYPNNLKTSHLIGAYLDLIYPYLKNIPDEKLNFFSLPFELLEGPYERGRVELKRNDWVIDAGAYIGMFSIFASKKVGNKGKIFSFEPIEKTQKLLKRNIELNKIKNIEIIQFALGNKKSELNFSTSSKDLRSSSGFFTFNQEEKEEKVNQISLDEFVRKNRIIKVDFIKADVEGMERDMIAGAEETIKKFKPKIAICAYHRSDDSEILEKMIRNFSSEYKIIKNNKKIFAWC